MRLSRALVLSALPGSGQVTADAVRSALDELPPGAVFDEGWLAPGEGYEALFSADEAEDMNVLRDRVTARLAGCAIDVNIVPDDLAFRRKMLLAADMESTIIEQELIDEMAGLVGRRAEVERITAATMRGEIDFEGSLRARVALFEGLAVERLESVFARVTLTPGAALLVGMMKACGAHTALVTGGFSVFAERVAAHVGFDEVHANVLDYKGGRLTGRVLEPILGPLQKRERLEGMCRRLGIDPVHSIAVGDGANDLDMLAAAGLGVAFRAKPKVAASVRANPCGAVVVHADLSALLHLQGFRST